MMQKRTFLAVFVIAAFALAASPVVAQMSGQNDQIQSSIQGGTIGSAGGGTAAPTQAPIGGVFCIEEMTANFCNRVTGPNTGGYGGRSGSASASSAPTTSAGGAAAGTSSIPPCPAEPPFNELCN